MEASVSAVELVRLPDVLESLELDTSDCPGAAPLSRLAIDDRLTLMGHSMGATIAPLVVAEEPRYRALILSGAGGSYIENIVHKRSPLEVRPIAEALLGYPAAGASLHVHDPVLSLLQWAGEGADPPVYADRLKNLHVLMMQGIVDTYILPSIANATSLSMGLDLAGPALDSGHPGLTGFIPLADQLFLSGGTQLSLPVSQNRGEWTRVVVQHPEDGVEDGHEVVFQVSAARSQYGLFLESLSQGTPTVQSGE